MDKDYWESYYKKHGDDQSISTKSSFAEFCLLNYFNDKARTIVEIGSGNGRDAIYFAHHNHKVIAIDQSITTLEQQRMKISSDINANLISISNDFTSMAFDFNMAIDTFYSRFTIHAITKDDQDLLLPKIYSTLEINGLFCIEVRTTKDPMFGIGQDCGNNTYLTDHKRRFIDSNVFLREALSLGFELIYFTEENNLSIHKDDNPVLMRIILKKV